MTTFVSMVQTRLFVVEGVSIVVIPFRVRFIILSWTSSLTLFLKKLFTYSVKSEATESELHVITVSCLVTKKNAYLSLICSLLVNGSVQSSGIVSFKCIVMSLKTWLNHYVTKSMLTTNDRSSKGTVNMPGHVQHVRCIYYTILLIWDTNSVWVHLISPHM
jgi:hypothetical protein